MNTLSFRIRYIDKLVVSVLLSITIIGSGALPLPSHEYSFAATSAVEKTITTGMNYVGTPYEFGSSRSSTRTFDCSDFTRYVYLKGAGLVLPATSAAQAAYVKKQASIQTNWTNLKRGDLMFFMNYHGSTAASYKNLVKSKQTVTHVAIYIGNGKMLHTYSNASGGVRMDSIDNKHWEYRFLFGGSPL